MQESLPPILDACCGSKSFWFDKNDARVIFMDIRSEVVETDTRPGRNPHIIEPDVIGDFTKMDFENESFSMVVFDPPHLVDISPKSWLCKKYGSLDGITWKRDIAMGFSECFRVLKPGGFLVFKWAEAHIPLSDVLSLTHHKPLFGHKTSKASKTHWIIFMKQPNTACTRQGESLRQKDLFSTDDNPVKGDDASPAPCG